jgi:hypothetical protein
MAGIKSEIIDIKKDIRVFELNTIAEIYKANLTVASFVSGSWSGSFSALRRAQPGRDARSSPNT